MIDRFDGTKHKFLSNFYISAINSNGIRFLSVEHAYQAAKSRDKHVQLYVAAASTAAEAKRRGRAILNPREDWNMVKVGIMKELLEQKFESGYLRDALLGTQDNELKEGNDWHDNFWGDCTCDDCFGLGENYLGRLLMEVRDDIMSVDHKCEPFVTGGSMILFVATHDHRFGSDTFLFQSEAPYVDTSEVEKLISDYQGHTEVCAFGDDCIDDNHRDDEFLDFEHVTLDCVPVIGG